MSRPLALSLACLFGCGSNGMAGVDAAGGGDDEPGADGSAASPRTVTLTLANRPINAAKFGFVVAYQDGSAPWAVAPTPSGDTYSLAIHAPSYGVAFTCIGSVAGGTSISQVRSVTTAHFAVGERTELALDVPPRCSDRVTPMITLSGNVTNRPGGNGVLAVQWGSRSAFVGSVSGNFTLTAPAGTHDLAVVRAIPEGNGDFYADEVWMARNVTLTVSTTRTIDFSDAEPTQYFDVNVDPGSARALATTTLYTANGTQGGLVRESSSWETQSLADVQMLASDVYDQSITVSKTGASATITNATNTPGDQDWVAPAPLGEVSAEVISKMPYLTVETSWPGYANAAGYTWSLTQSQPLCDSNTPCTTVWSSYLSPGVVGTAKPSYAMPDLASLPGWSPSLAFGEGAPIAGNLTAFTSSAGGADFPPGAPANGTKRVYVRTDFAIAP